MKKILALLLALVMALALCACSKDDSPTIDSGTGTTTASSGTDKIANNLSAFKGRLIENTMTIIASGNYMYEVKDPTSAMVATYAKYGSNNLITVTIDSTTLSFINKDGQKYIAIPTNQVYARLNDEQYNTYFASWNEMLSKIDFSGLLRATFSETGDVEYNGQTYKFEDYYNPLNQRTNRFLFDANSNLCYFTSSGANGELETPAAIKVYASTATIFDVLETYQLVDANQILPSSSTQSSTSTNTETSSTAVQ